MTEHPGVEGARASIEAFNRGDMTALREFYADDVVWHVGGTHGLSGDYRGRDELFGYFAKVREMTGGTLRLEPEAILTSEEHTAIFMKVSGQRDGKTLGVTLAEAFTMGPDGRWTEFWSLADDQDAVDTFWS
jgi:ketosteroid isomerase-like protein